MAWIAFFAGLAVLLVGAELFVRGSSRMAAAFGVPALVIGLTVVAFGTSAPEAAVGVQSVVQGNADIGLGNVIGSNIANVLLILGLASLISPLPVSARVVRVDVPVMIGFSALHVAISWWFNYWFVYGKPTWFDAIFFGLEGRSAWDGGCFGLG